MTNQEILTKAIQIAIKGEFQVANPTMDTPEKIISWFYYPGGYSDNRDDYMMIIFNHDFAKALWGDAKVCDGDGSGLHFEESCICEYTRPFLLWQYHLQMMVISPQPLEYLANNLPIDRYRVNHD